MRTILGPMTGGAPSLRRATNIFRLYRRATKKAGLPPGTLVFTGEKKVENVSIRLIEYNESDFREKDILDMAECAELKGTGTVKWINVKGIHHMETIEKLGRIFDIHPLVLEDIVNVEQRPKMEDFEDYLFIVMKMHHYDDESGDVSVEQVSLIVTHDCVITLQEKDDDLFDKIRERIRTFKGKTRKMGVDYLAYALIDAIVDSYFVILDKMGEETERLQDELVANPTPETLHEIHRMKRNMLFMRRSVWPLREAIGALRKGESDLMSQQIDIYLMDVYDHTIQVIDTVETLRDMVSGMLDIYLSSMSNKMNETMKVLTIIATIFIPLSFVAGVYGMNFEGMPELGWSLGYPLVLTGMATAGAIMLIWFRKRKWI